MGKLAGTAEKEYTEDLNNYWLGTTHSARQDIEKKADEYKRDVLKRLRPVEPRALSGKSRRISIPKGSVVMLKRDGEYNLLYYDAVDQPESIFCNSPNGRARARLPVNDEIEAHLAKINDGTVNIETDPSDIDGRISLPVKQIVLAGELWADMKKDDRPRVFDFLRASRSPGSMDDLKAIRYDIFDLLSINFVDLSKEPMEKKIALLESLELDDNTYFSIIPYDFIEAGSGIARARELYESWVEEGGQEGLVIRTPYQRFYKIKPIHDVDAVIVGYVEMAEEKKVKGMDSISTLLVALMRPGGAFQLLAKVGGGFTEDQRIDFYNLLNKNIVESNYIYTKSDGRAFHFVKPEHIIKINFMDVIADASDRQIRKMALDYDPKSRRYTTERAYPFVSLISPRFDVLRTEIDGEEYPSLEYENPKEVVEGDLRLEQVTSLVPIDTVEVPPAELPKAKTLLRVVFEGTSKPYVRKAIIWKTNKDDLDEQFSKYVLYHCDYSFQRKEPLQQKMYPFSSLGKALDAFNEIFLDNFTTKTISPYVAKVDDSILEKAKKHLDPEVTGAIGVK